MFDDVMKRLESLGNERVRALSYRNGVGENQFGVKSGDLRIVAKDLKKDPKLVAALWASGNLDAQLLAVLLMTPKRIPASELETMVKSAVAIPLSDWLNSYVVKQHPEKETLRQRWMHSDDPMLGRAAWSLTAQRVASSAEGLDLAALLDRIEAELLGAPAPVQWTMNSCLAELGIHHPALRERAIAIGERLGLYRDFPTSKGCTSPFAPSWITELVKRQA